MASDLIGSWRVVRFQRWDKDGAESLPLGAQPVGAVIFDATGTVSIQLGRGNDGGTAEEIAKSFMAYFGPFSTAGDALTITVVASNMPDYIGSTQKRTFKLSGDSLTIGTPGRYQATLERAR
jgi:hypothetical protein